jgi:DNA-binding NarL/FixJ family response regulator
MLVENLEKELRQLKKSVERDTIEKKLVELHRKKILTNDDWIEYLHSFAELHPGFYTYIKHIKGISEGDQRQLVFIKLGFSLKEASYLMGISVEGVKRARQRLTKKLGLTDASRLKDFVESNS